MKHNLLLVFWLINSFISYRAIAQTPNNLPPVNNCGESNEEVCIETSGMGVQAYRQNLFGNLNLSPAEVPSGALMEYSLTGWDADKMNGVVNDTFSRADWFGLYGAMYAAKVNENLVLAHPDTVFERAKAYRIQNKIPVLVLNLPYHHIRQTALAEGLFTTDADTTTLFDVAGRTVSPYALKRMFAVSIYDKICDL